MSLVYDKRAKLKGDVASLDHLIDNARNGSTLEDGLFIEVLGKICNRLGYKMEAKTGQPTYVLAGNMPVSAV